MHKISLQYFCTISFNVRKIIKRTKNDKNKKRKSQFGILVNVKRRFCPSWIFCPFSSPSHSFKSLPSHQPSFAPNSSFFQIQINTQTESWWVICFSLYLLPSSLFTHPSSSSSIYLYSSHYILLISTWSYKT